MAYPKNRRKKVPHEQYMQYEKVVKRGQTISAYTMVYDNGWWACDKAAGGKDVFWEGERFRGVARVPAYLGYPLDRVTGYVAVITISHKRPNHYKFVFVKEPVAAKEIYKPLTSKYRKSWNKVGRKVGWRKWVDGNLMIVDSQIRALKKPQYKGCCQP